MMSPEEIGAILEGQQYKFAKTMPWLPHWYTLKDTWDNPSLYRDVIAWILCHGELRVWGKKRTVRRYFDFGEYRYWPMTTDPDESILLNRARIDTDKSEPLPPVPAHPYDDVALEYDHIWSGEEALQEDRQIMEMIGYKSGSVLDIGCGTGLFLDHYPHAEPYLGIDPSQAMLNELLAKHPESQVLPQTFEDTIPVIGDTQYDYVLSLFGSASYIPPRKLAKTLSLVKPGGKLFLMFISPHYTPITHQYIENPPLLYKHKFESYGDVSTLGNYTIVQG
jgi:SAM-dependent methyltransferase